MTIPTFKKTSPEQDASQAVGDSPATTSRRRVRESRNALSGLLRQATSHYLLVAEESPQSAELRAFLESSQERVHILSPRENPQAFLKKHPMDLVILDLSGVGAELPLISQVRKAGPVGLILINPQPDKTDWVGCLNAGADAILPANTDAVLIQAMARSLLRRSQPLAPANEPAADKEGDWILDNLSWVLHAPSGEMVKLSVMEKLLLETLTRQNGQVVPRSVLCNALGKTDTPSCWRSIDTLVLRLRRKVLEHLQQPLPLSAAYGRGYAFTATIRQGRGLPLQRLRA
ncbi:MAG: response regulator transcription factor [Magnetococcales bacterium]|nr:response regulator transcription factor [Magnetococcales bacterium]